MQSITSQQNIVSLIHIFCSFLVVSCQWKEIGLMPIKNFLRNRWNWEITKPFLHAVHFQMAQALDCFGLPFSVAWACQMIPLKKCNRFLPDCALIQFYLLLPKCTASATPINLFPHLLSCFIHIISTLKSPWNMSSLKCKRFSKPSRKREQPRPRRPWSKRFHVKMHPRMLKQQLFSVAPN